MSRIIPLQNQELPETCYVFKNSTACPVSAAAAEEVRAATPSLDIYWIDVIEQRELSNWVEEKYETRHESPQLLHIVDGAVKDSWSHNKVTRDKIS